MQHINSTNANKIRDARCDGTCARAQTEHETHLGNIVFNKPDRAIGPEVAREAPTGNDGQQSNVTPTRVKDGKLTMSVGDAAD